MARAPDGTHERLPVNRAWLLPSAMPPDQHADGTSGVGARTVSEGRVVASPQTLSEADRRLVAAWAADCAERVLPIFEAEAPDDDRPRALIARARAFARGELATADEIRRRFAGGVGADDVKAPAAMAAARAAGQAVAVCHMGAHALGAAAYALRAAGLADPDRPEAIEDEIGWQLGHMSTEVRAALVTAGFGAARRRAQDEGFPTVWPDQADQHLDQRGLACAIGPEQADDLAG